MPSKFYEPLVWLQYQANYGYLKSTHKIQIKFYSKSKLWFTIYCIDQVDLGVSYLELGS